MTPNEQLTAKIEEYCVLRMEWDREYSRQFALNLAGYLGESKPVSGDARPDGVVFQAVKDGGQVVIEFYPELHTSDLAYIAYIAGAAASMQCTRLLTPVVQGDAK